MAKGKRGLRWPQGRLPAAAATVPVLQPACPRHGACLRPLLWPLAPPPTKRIIFFFYRQKQTNKQTKGKGAHCTLRREGEEPGPRDSCRDAPARAATEPAAPGSLSSRRSRGPGRVPHPLPGSRASPRNPLLKRESPGVSPKVTGGASPGGQGCSCLLSGLRDI